MARHLNIPLFVVHMGCPNQCVFCDQRLISGISSFCVDDARREIEATLAAAPADAEIEIAFFGGSFTGIDRALMIRLLDMAREYTADSRVRGIRFSTRPDYISEEILGILAQYPITMAELGVQSLSDSVLEICRRGHSAADTERAFALLRGAGIPVGAQMMIGLPGASAADESACAEMCCRMGAAAYRVYPTVVFRGTELDRMRRDGAYTPLTVEEAAARMARVMEIFDSHGVRCLRAGLCDAENLHDPASYAAGPNHPAIGEIARGEIFYARMRAALDGCAVQGRNVRFFVPRGAASHAAGHSRRNILRILAEYGIKSAKIIENPALIGYNIRMEISEKKSGNDRREARRCD